MVPNPQRLESTLKTIEEVTAARKHNCRWYKACLNAADAHEWKSFSCAQCEGEIQEREPVDSNFIRKLVVMIIVQAYLDIEQYNRLVQKIGHTPEPPYDRYGKYAGEIVKDYQRSLMFFNQPFEGHESYCHYLVAKAGYEKPLPVNKIMTGLKEAREHLGRKVI